jgi:hypothetical protein
MIQHCRSRGELEGHGGTHRFELTNLSYISASEVNLVNEENIPTLKVGTDSAEVSGVDRGRKESKNSYGGIGPTK